MHLNIAHSQKFHIERIYTTFDDTKLRVIYTILVSPGGDMEELCKKQHSASGQTTERCTKLQGQDS